MVVVKNLVGCAGVLEGRARPFVANLAATVRGRVKGIGANWNSRETRATKPAAWVISTGKPLFIVPVHASPSGGRSRASKHAI